MPYKYISEFICFTKIAQTIAMYSHLMIKRRLMINLSLSTAIATPNLQILAITVDNSNRY